MNSERVARVAVVTAGLSMSGGVVGAVCASISVAAIVAVYGGIHALASTEALQLMGTAAGAGAVAGMIGAPLLGWGLLRQVPLGRAILVTAMGTIIGAVGGQLLNPYNPYARTIPGVIAGTLAGFFVAGLSLRLRSRRTGIRVSAKQGVASISSRHR